MELSEITRLLQAWSQGDQRALDELTPYVYKELHRVAHRYMSREARGHTLQTAALIKAYLLLSGFRRVVVVNVPWYLSD